MTGPTLDASKMSDRMLVPLGASAKRWRIPAIVGVSVAVVGSALGIFMFSKSSEEAESTPAAEVEAKPEPAASAEATPVSSATAGTSATAPSASQQPKVPAPRMRWRQTKTGRDVGY